MQGERCAAHFVVLTIMAFALATPAALTAQNINLTVR